MSNFEQKIRKETYELQRLYLDNVDKISHRMVKIVDMVSKNNAEMKKLAESSKVAFAMFDMKRRNLGGNNAALRPVMDSIWGASLQLDPDV